MKHKMKYCMFILILIIERKFIECLDPPKSSKNTFFQPRILFNDVEDESDNGNLTDPNWNMNLAVRNVAFSLRAHKFRDYDRRYYKNINKVEYPLYSVFPKPPISLLHWEVYDRCNKGFIKCLKYLENIVNKASFKRDSDALYIKMINHQLSNSEYKLLVHQCEIARNVDDRFFAPFRGEIERFRWRTTASYFMCWYTMLEKPELKYFSEPCDNFANCGVKIGNYISGDPRGNDNTPFGCAMYSFCPDPCCPKRNIFSWDECYQNKTNPCFDIHTENTNCSFRRENNQDFFGIVNNYLNITCQCPLSGWEWSSKYGICIDINECDRGLHNCSSENHEFCYNLPGGYNCMCKLGHFETFGKCVPHMAFKSISLKTFKYIPEHSLISEIINFLTLSSNASSINYFNTVFLYLSFISTIILYITF